VLGGERRLLRLQSLSRGAEGRFAPPFSAGAGGENGGAKRPCAPRDSALRRTRRAGEHHADPNPLASRASR